MLDGETTEIRIRWTRREDGLIAIGCSTALEPFVETWNTLEEAKAADILKGEIEA